MHEDSGPPQQARKLTVARHGGQAEGIHEDRMHALYFNLTIIIAEVMGFRKTPAEAPCSTDTSWFFFFPFF